MEYINDFEREFGISQEPFGLATNEIEEAAETGHDVSAQRERIAGLGASGADDAELSAIYASLPLRPPAGWPYFEESGLDAIRAQLPEAEVRPAPHAPELASRLRGAWFGRVAGNMLGKPVEFGWPRAAQRAYLEQRNAYPLDDYYPIGADELAHPEDSGFTMGQLLPYAQLARGGVDGGVRDDDVDYTILGLHLLETYGPGFRTYDVAHEWLTRLPVYQTYTAERAAYNNLVREVPIEETGEYHNPFREWIGALIRADIHGYVTPGRPRVAAELAYRDAVLSHRSNGIYGEMWAAALISTAFTAETPVDSVRQSLDHVPPTSRLGEEIRRVLGDHTAGRSWDEAMDALDARYPATSWVHTLNNAGALTAAILWGDGDFSATIGYATLAGLDTDSIGATAGSWAGAFLGYDGIPVQWLEPLHGRTRSAVFGFSDIALDDVAARTLRLVEAFR